MMNGLQLGHCYGCCLVEALERLLPEPQAEFSIFCGLEQQIPQANGLAPNSWIGSQLKQPVIGTVTGLVGHTDILYQLVIDILIVGQEVKWSTGVDGKQELRQPGQLQKLQMDSGGMELPIGDLLRSNSGEWVIVVEMQQ